MLTQKQRDLLMFIHDYTSRTGLSPSFEEMKEGLDLKSKSGIHRLINALVERGFLERLPNKARALEVKRLPENASGTLHASASGVRSVSSPATVAAIKNPKAGVKPNFKQSMPAMPAANSDMAEVPLYGKIAAGSPIEALRHETDMIGVPFHMMGNTPCYALTIEGDSMSKAGIMDGDIVIIEECDRANDGDIVVALVDEEEVTLKRLRREVGSVVLMPENDAYQPIRLPPHRVRIQGRLRSLLRTY
ncbi:MAG TPA: transcriptional repressor LexA [Alphaproteobacteria bacterium]|nr:repressor LexA [Rhodospirillaceae bacterium]HRJ65608.1 transcriptional repressor LexA [Alphaproteobacteria bacterium]